MMLGIIIGIATLTVIVSMAKGAQHKVMMGIRNFGPNAVMASAGGGKMFGPLDGRTTTLTLDDVKAIRDTIPGLLQIAPSPCTLARPWSMATRIPTPWWLARPLSLPTPGSGTPKKVSSLATRTPPV